MKSILGLIVAGTLAWQAQAAELCNKSKENASVMAGKTWQCGSSGPPFNDPTLCATTTGWYQLNRGECKNLDGNLFFARGEHGTILTQGNNNSVRLCTVAIKNAADNQNACKNAGGSLQPFAAQNTLEGGVEIPTSLKFCNKTVNEPINLAVAYYFDDAIGWRSQGWWVIQKGNCATIRMPHQEYDSDAYVHAFNNKGVVISGEGSFCSAREKFLYDKANYHNSCNGPGEAMVKFRKVKVYKHNIKGYDI